MTETTQKQQKIVFILLEKGRLSSSAIHAQMVNDGHNLSLVTVKRTLSSMVKAALLVMEGSGPATAYVVSALGRLFADIDANAFGRIEPDRRYGLDRYNFELLQAIPEHLFSDREMKLLEEATAQYRHRATDPVAGIQKKEWERLVIELSWKSSKIEGNTYTLLDTEKLILRGIEATGHSKEEAQMILNHKDAFFFVHTNADQFKQVTRANLEKLHSIIVKDLPVSQGLRKKAVGILGSRYRPLDNIQQIAEALDALCAAIRRMRTPYDKALVALLGISYIQPFENGNKRTSRLMTNALLLAHGYAPLSYRSLEEKEYRDATLVFYELNSLMPLKHIFISQYDFAARNYAAT